MGLMLSTYHAVNIFLDFPRTCIQYIETPAIAIRQCSSKRECRP
uniref:Uncharacterized protein n=1 Tax=Arundo donax TaxID=35708 RepID=A0A0A9CLH9_ARUDO